MASFNRKSYLATCGNYDLKPAGEAIFNVNGTLNVLAGEFVVFDSKTNLSLDVASVATARHISMAVGLGTNGRMAKDLRYLGGDKFDFCKDTIKVRARPSRCAIPMVQDAYFDCTKCNEAYTMIIDLDDSYVRSNFCHNETVSYPFTITTDCCDCKDCDPTHNCDEVACKFKDAINGKKQDNPFLVPFFQKQALEGGVQGYQPFYAAQLFLETATGQPNTSHTWNFAKTGDVCETCKFIPAISGIILDGVQTDFTGVSNPADPTTAFLDQATLALDQIREALSSIGGSAFLKGGTQKCCPFAIEINTCADQVELIVAGVATAADTSENPYSPIDTKEDCKPCDTSTPFNPTCGIRIFVDPVDFECDCQYPPNLPTPNLWTRSIDIQEGAGFDCNGFHTKVICEPVAPEGLGVYWQDQAHYGQHNGGSGGDWRYSNRHVGKIGLPDKGSRVMNAANGIKCEESYCSLNVVSSHTRKRLFGLNAKHTTNCNLSYLLMPDADLVTINAVIPILTALQDRGLCEAGPITCS